MADRLDLNAAILSEVPGLLERLEALTGQKLELVLVVHGREPDKPDLLGMLAASTIGAPNVEALLANAIAHHLSTGPLFVAVDRPRTH